MCGKTGTVQLYCKMKIPAQKMLWHKHLPDLSCGLASDRFEYRDGRLVDGISFSGVSVKQISDAL